MWLTIQKTLILYTRSVSVLFECDQFQTIDYYQQVTIIPRGPSLGHTAYIPEKERYHVTRSQLLAMMDVAMGGRAAEELIFGHEKITSGASSDLKVN